MDHQSNPLHAGASVVRLLPSYDDVNVPYSLRLPAYRSSYMRRFHPYARYYTPTEMDNSMDELLDLSIIEIPILLPTIQPAVLGAVQDVNNVQEPENATQEMQGDNEELILVADPVEPQDQEGNQTGPFLRVDMVNT